MQVGSAGKGLAFPHAGLRTFHQKSTCITQFTSGPQVVQIWPEFWGDEKVDVLRVVGYPRGVEKIEAPEGHLKPLHATLFRVCPFSILRFAFRVSNFGLRVSG